jgi:hypothetical protein
LERELAEIAWAQVARAGGRLELGLLERVESEEDDWRISQWATDEERTGMKQKRLEGKGKGRAEEEMDTREDEKEDNKDDEESEGGEEVSGKSLAERLV